MYQRPTLSETRTFGVEIEAFHPSSLSYDTIAQKLSDAGVPSRTRYGWTPHQHRNYSGGFAEVCGDGSLRNAPRGYYGFEVATPPIKGLAGIVMIEKICKVLNDLGCKLNKSAGLHVHHDASDMDTEAWKTMMKLYAKNEATIDTYVAPTRRGNTNQWCRSLLQGSNLSSFFARVDSCRTIQDVQYLHAGRYYKVNTKSYSAHGTVEIRQHHGTMNAVKIINWVALTQQMVEQSVAHTVVALEPERIDHIALFDACRIADSVADWFITRSLELA